MRFALVALALFVALAATASYGRTLSNEENEFLFTRWMAQHGKSYSTPDIFQYRYQVWKANMDYIVNFPANYPNATWSVAMNEFGDLTREEFKGRFNSYVPRANRTRNIVDLPTTGLPSSVDWRTKGAVTPVKNQGSCGSCWAFSTTGSTEGAWFIAKGQLVSLSEQELVDCAQSTGNQGCEGGLMDDAFQWIINNGGICSESSYPYQGVDGTCNESSCQSVVTISSFTDVTPQSDPALMAAVAQQPVSVAVEADQSYWQFYSGGIVSDPGCGTNLDHGVLIVGYGTSGSQNYWIVKNSWGASWGESGYIRLIRGQDECGINSDPSYPNI